MMTRSLTRAEAAQWLARQDRFAILTHRRPDGDTLGSAAALCMGLRRLGKTAHVLENPETTPKYAPMLLGLTKEAPEAGDALVAVDVACAGLLPEKHRHFASEIALRIDHHATDEPFGMMELVDSAAGACGELIYDLMEELPVALDQAMARAVYTAISTDTGCFRYANTTVHTFLTAAACARTGADLHGINLALFETNTLQKLRIQGWIAENTRFFAGGKVAVCALPLDVERQIGVTEDDMDGISGFPRSIEGVQIAALLRQIGDGTVKVSVRAVPRYDAAAVCAKLGGGGHRGAGGCTLRMPLEEAAAAVIAAMPEMD